MAFLIYQLDVVGVFWNVVNFCLKHVELHCWSQGKLFYGFQEHNKVLFLWSEWEQEQKSRGSSNAACVL